MTHTNSPFGPGGPVAGRAVSTAPEQVGAFERVFNPTQPGILGIIGRVGGARTQTQLNNEQALGARSAGLSALAHQLSADESGLNTQRIVLDFLSSSEGMQGLQADPDFLSKVKAMVAPSMLSPTGRARRDLAAQAEVPVEEIADLELLKMEQDLLTLEERELTARAETLGVSEKSILELEQALRQAELTDPTGSQRAFAGLAKQLGLTTEELGKINLDRKRAELIQLERRNKMTAAARDRAALEFEAGEAPGTVASLEFQKARGELITAEARARNERAELLGVDPAILAKVEQTLQELEITDPTGANRARADLAKVLGITLKELEEVDLNRKRAELAKIERQNIQSDEARERAKLEKEAGVPPGTIAKTKVETALLTPDVRNLIQIAELTGKTKEEQQELIKKAAVAKLVVETGGRTQEERAFIALVDKGIVSQTEAEFVLSKSIEVVPVQNAVGEPTGEYDLVNLITEDVRRVSPTSAADKKALQGMVGAAAPSPAPTTEVAPGEPGAAPESRVPAEIINQSGVVPLALRVFYGLAEQVVTPSAETTLRKQQQNTLEVLGNRFRDYVAGEGRMLAIEASTLAPIVDNIRPGKSPGQVGGSLLAMHNIIDADEAIAVKLLEGPKQELLTDTQRERLSRMRVDAIVMRAQLPTREALKFELEAGQHRDPLDAVRGALEGVEGVLGVQVPDSEDDAVVPPAAALTPPPGGGPPIAAATDADSVVPPAGAVDSTALPEKAEPSLFDNTNLQQFVPPALRARVAEWDAVIEVIATTIQPVIDASTAADNLLAVPILRQISNVGVGFNVALAQFIGIAPEALNEAIVLLGHDGFLDEPGDAVEALMSAFEAVDFVPAPGHADLNSFVAGLGEEVFNASVAAAVFLVAAPVLAAAKGWTIVQYAGKQALQFARDHSLLFALTTAGAAVGPDIADFLLGSKDMDPILRELLRTIGAFAGGAMGGMVVAGSKVLLKARIPKTPFMKKPPADEQGAMNISHLRDFSRKQVDADIKETNNLIRGVIEDLAPGVLGKGKGGAKFSSPEKAVAALGRALRNIERGPARLRERQLWANIGGKRDMTPGLPKIITWARLQIKKTGADTESLEIPKGAILRILNWERVAENGTKTYAKRSIGDLLKLRGAWLEAIRNPKTSTQHRAFYKKAQRRLLTEIERQWPNDPRVQTALSYSRWLNARFNSPALEGFMLGHKGGDFDPEKTIGTLVRLIRVDKGAPSVTVLSDIAITLNRPQLMETARSFIRNQFGAFARSLDEQAVQAAGPGLTKAETAALGRKAGGNAGRDFLNSKTTKAFAEAFPKVKVETDFAIDKLSTALRAQTAVQETAFAAFAGTNTRDAVQGLMTSPNRVDMVRELISRLPPSARGVRPNALDALRNGMVDWLFRSTNVEAVKASTVIAQLNQPGIRQVFRMVYSSSEMKRLDRLLASANAVQLGQISWAARVIDNTIGKGARILGALFAAKVIKSGTVQIPGMFAQMAGDIASRLTGIGSSARLLAMAMVDPNMERVLLARIPRNLTEVRKLTDLMRLVTTIITDATRLPVSQPDPGVAQ